MIGLTVTMNDHDFERLTVNSCRNSPDLVHHGYRFRDRDGKPVHPGRLASFLYGYWFEGYADVLLARAFLDAGGHEYLLASDEYTEEPETAHDVTHHGHSPGWVIFSRYMSPGWKLPADDLSSRAGA